MLGFPLIECANFSREVRKMPETIEAVIEIPRGSRNKYEMDHATGKIRLDRVLYSSVQYPTDYGFLPGTLALDGDPLDVLVLVEEPTFPGTHVGIRPIGLMRMQDQKGVDEKIVAVLSRDPRFEEIRTLGDLAPHWLREIETFFSTYKVLEGLPVEVHGWDDREAAWQTITDAQARAGEERQDAGP